MNISIVKLGHEECELCTTSTEHQKQSGHSTVQSSEGDDLCTICDKFSVHLNFAAMSREAYRKDGDNVKPGCVVLAVDLQKVS